jgi:hypothetical protein
MKKELERVRGIFERPAGSGVWWINYYVNGKQHREKAGRRSDAVALYQKRKAHSRRKIKLPELVPSKVVTFGHLSAMAVEHARTHLRTSRDYRVHAQYTLVQIQEYRLQHLPATEREKALRKVLG